MGINMKTAIINARIKPELKADVEAILSQLGMTTTQAITVFFEQVKMNKGIPFELKIPNAETIEAMEEARADRDMESITIEDLKAQLIK
ncbi:DNA-damage-inducible protein J [Bathymodiolus platifrons methanotrophic gill symbiont]|nr:type II toxin-antitoxin system antitoxin, RelB/DinJ family [Methylococcaceae bacterium CS4]TXL01169.1 type II toxin-antitoxin system antitoxin, RelB/DinJ family [Methylococcaceae bacterium CS5]TXL01883.1 type II toxin-antitoxin system antitoxin, RelB/DinJ family [Methylococcaceae bacterium CS1]TXL07667.1 type II toxin-antitoxin system antitoxin, RelB/DinJ family [Methylococcaceae bacterium CS3]TXL08874.1 type II toxin-antitoxin system antitoxin, RelB/DinJ family [Methylococcaceae bacterium C